jgi:hypothetical protein
MNDIQLAIIAWAPVLALWSFIFHWTHGRWKWEIPGLILGFAGMFGWIYLVKSFV